MLNCKLWFHWSEDQVAGTIEAHLERVRKELTRVKRRLARHYDALETEALSMADLAPRIQELTAMVDELQSREFDLLEQLEVESFMRVSEKEVLDHALHLRRTLAQGEISESKEFLAAFIAEIRVDNRGVQIHYGLPKLAPEVEADMPSVLRSVTQSGTQGTRT